MAEVKEKFDINERVMDFIYDVQYGQISGSYNITIDTVRLLEDIIVNTNWKTAQELISVIKFEGKKITKSLPFYSSVGNMIRRILKIIREEYIALCKNRQDEAEESLHKILTSEGQMDDFSKEIPQLNLGIIDHINEFKLELETSSENIAQQAKEHIDINEIIMTFGKSKTVEAFLKKAAQDRNFEVIVAVCAPDNSGHELAINLAKSKVKTTVIADSAIFGMMSRVNKVIIGTHTVMANGGLRAACGSHSVALAAKYYSVPVIVLSPLYQLSPQYLCSYDQDSFNNLVTPEGVLKYSDDILSKIHIYNPLFDYVPPELVGLFISDNGGHASSYVYRLLSELYHPEDYEF